MLVVNKADGFAAEYSQVIYIMKNADIVKEPFLYRSIKTLVVGLFSLIFRPRIYGKENIPSEGAVVLAGNHMKFWDCFMVMAGTKRCVHFLAKAELFGNAFTKWFFTTAGIIPVYRNGKDKAALEDAEKYLSNGCVIGIFPEGTTKKNGAPLLPFKIGAVKMAVETVAPIVPFVVNGKYKPFKSGVEITFLEPIYAESDDLDEENARLRDIVYNNMKK